MRKLIGFSKGSFVVSMPKSWVEKNHLKKGDLMAINENGCELVIAPNSAERKEVAQEVTIDANGKDLERLKCEIVSSYLNNCDTINIVSNNLNDQASKIKEIIRNLSGLEIMEQTGKRIVAKDLINLNEISIKNIIRRMDVITRAMIDDAMNCAKGYDCCEAIDNRDIDINRLYFLAKRVIKSGMKNSRIAKALGSDSWKLHSDKLVLMRIESIADNQKRIARYSKYANLSRDAINELKKLHFDIGENYKDVMKSYYNMDLKLATDIEVLNKERTRLCDKFLEKYANISSVRNSKSRYTEHVALAKIIENVKAMSTSVKDIARTTLCYS